MRKIFIKLRLNLRYIFIIVGISFIGYYLYARFVKNDESRLFTILLIGFVFLFLGVFWHISAKRKYTTKKEMEIRSKKGQRQNELALKYYNGEGVHKDLKKSKRLFERAAKNNNTDAKCNLALLFRNEIPFYKYCKYIEEAAKAGNIKAREEMPKMLKDKKLVEEAHDYSNKYLQAHKSSNSTTKASSSTNDKKDINEIDKNVEQERDAFHHYETKISVRYYNEHSGFMGQIEYDADADVTFYYKNAYNQIKTRSTSVKFSNVRYNTVTVSDCEYRCQSYLKEY